MKEERNNLVWQEIGGRFGSNLARVKVLAEHADSTLQIQLGGITDLRSDILRSAIILLHATLEDLLRSVAEVLLPMAAANHLKDIPLLGSMKPRQTTFTLEDLAAHRGRDVSDLIAKSVTAYLERSNYNHPGDIKCFPAVGRNSREFMRSFLPSPRAMMSRRHLIAHRADRRVGVGAAPLAIESLTVEEWIDNVALFGGALLGLIRSKLPDDVEADQ